MRAVQVSSWSRLRLYVTSNAPGRGDDCAQNPVRVHMVVSKFREKAANPHPCLVNRGFRSRRAGNRSVTQDPNVHGLPGIQRQTNLQLATFVLAGRVLSVNG